MCAFGEMRRERLRGGILAPAAPLRSLPASYLLPISGPVQPWVALGGRKWEVCGHWKVAVFGGPAEPCPLTLRTQGSVNVSKNG